MKILFQIWKMDTVKHSSNSHLLRSWKDIMLKKNTKWIITSSKNFRLDKNLYIKYAIWKALLSSNQHYMSAIFQGRFSILLIDP